MTTNTSESYINTNFILACITRFTFGVVFTMLLACSSVYAVKTYDVSTGYAGFSAGIFVVSMAVIRFVFSKYTDIIGRKRILIVSSVLYLMCSLAYLLPLGFIGFVIIRIVHGAAGGMLNNTIVVVGSSCIPPNKFGEGLGVFGLGATLSNAVGPFVGLLMVNVLDGRLLFYVASVCSLVTLISSITMKPDECKLTQEQRNEITNGGIKSCFDVRAVPTGIVILIANVCYMGVASFISLYLSNSTSSWFSPWFFVVYSIGLCIARPVAGKLFDTNGENKTIYPAFAIFAFGMLFFSVNTSTPAVIVFAVMLAFGYGSLMPILQAIATSRVQAHELSVALSTFYVLSDIGLGFGPTIVGCLVQPFGYNITYLIMSIMVVILAISYRHIKR